MRQKLKFEHYNKEAAPGGGFLAMVRVCGDQRSVQLMQGSMLLTIKGMSAT